MNKLVIMGVVSALALSYPAFTAQAATTPAHAKTVAVKKVAAVNKTAYAIANLKKAQKDLTGETDAHAVKALDLVNNALSELQPAAK